MKLLQLHDIVINLGALAAIDTSNPDNVRRSFAVPDAQVENTLVEMYLTSDESCDFILWLDENVEDATWHHKASFAGYIQVIGPHYGRGCGRHVNPLWEVVLTNAGRAVLAHDEEVG